jgi:rod shape-determining protein MreC
VYDRSVYRRRRAVLAVLVGLSLILLTAHFGESESGPLHSISRGTQVVLEPIEAGASRALQPFRDLAGWTGDVLGAKGDNEKLEDENERLREQLAESQTATRDAQELRRLLDLPKQEGYPNAETVAARVIVRSPTVWYSTIQIDKGEQDGIREDMPVVAAGGLLGRVTAVSEGTAQVTLITDAESAVSAEVLPDGANGVIKPDVGEPNDLLLDFVEKDRPIRSGNMVVTSGFTGPKLESIFPRGIPIGKVTRIDPDERELYQRVHIEPYVDFRRVDTVQVITSKPRDEPTDFEGSGQ